MAQLYGNAVPLWTRLFPGKAEGPRGINVTFPLSTVQTFSIPLQLQGRGISQINGVFIDNSANAQAFTLFNPVTLQLIFVPANSQARLSLLTQQTSDAITFVGSSTGGIDIVVMFSNVEPPSDTIWSSVAPGAITGTVTIQGNVTTTTAASAVVQVNPTLAVAATSQLLFAALPARKRLIIQNPYLAADENIGAAEAIYVRFDGTAATQANGFEILPGASYDSGGGQCPNGAINWIAATVNHRIKAAWL